MPLTNFKISVKIRDAFFEKGYLPLVSLYGEDIYIDLVDYISLTEEEKSTNDLLGISQAIWQVCMLYICNEYNKTFESSELEKVYFLIQILIGAETTKKVKFCAEVDQKIKNFLQIFPDGESAERFLTEFYDTGRKKIESALEYQPGLVTLHALQLVHELSIHTDIICHSTYRNKFKRVLTYLEIISEFVETLSANFDAALSILMQAAVKEHGTITDADERQKSSYVELMRVWTTKLELVKNKQATPQKLIEIYLEIAICIIGAKNTLTTLQSKLLIEIGIGLNEIQEFSQLQPVNSDHMLPNQVVVGYGYFICKLSADDPRGPFLGIITGSCQHLRGEARTSAIYGYTYENSCFYVMFKGNPPGLPIDTKQLSTNRIVAECWAWRQPGSDTIIFDSIVVGHRNESKERQNNAKLLFFKLAEALVNQSDNVTNPKPNRVMHGLASNKQKCTASLRDVGIARKFTNIGLVPIPANPWHIENDSFSRRSIYSEAHEQMLLYDRQNILIAAIRAAREDIVSAVLNSSFLDADCLDGAQEALSITAAEQWRDKDAISLLLNAKLQQFTRAKRMGPNFS